MHHIAKACENNITVMNLILSSLLKNDGHITESSIIRKALIYLSTPMRGVLSRVRVNKRAQAGKKCYRLNPRYAGIVSAFSAATSS
jgi:hypothetical protein